MASADPIILTCKSLTGDVFKIEVTQQDTVKQAKEKLAGEIGCSPTSLKLMKGRKFLKDDSKTMADYEISESMKIKVVIRLKPPVTPFTESSLNCTSPRSVALTPDDKFLAVGTYGGEVYIINTCTGKHIVQIKPHPGAIRKLEWNKAGTKLLTAGYDSCAKRFQWTGDDLIEELTYSYGETNCHLWAVHFSEDENYVCTAGTCNQVKIFDANTGTEYRSFTHTQNVRSLAISQDFRYIAGGGANGDVLIWDIDTKDLVTTIRCPARVEVWRCVMPKLCDEIYICEGNRAIYLHNIESGELLKQFPIKTYSFDLIKDEQYLIYQCQQNSSIAVCDVSGEKEPEILVECSHTEQMCYAHFKNAFTATTNSGVNFTKIPEEKFYGAL